VQLLEAADVVVGVDDEHETEISGLFQKWAAPMSELVCTCC
jgi:hypothetical protein